MFPNTLQHRHIFALNEFSSVQAPQATVQLVTLLWRRWVEMLQGCHVKIARVSHLFSSMTLSSGNLEIGKAFHL